MKSNPTGFSLCLVYRKKNDLFFSIEKVFAQVSGEIEKELTIRSVNVPFYSSSIWHIVKNIWFLRKEKATLFHITGDIHYAVLAFSKKKTILTIHDCVFIHRYKGIKKWIISFLFLKWPVYRSRFVTTISEKTRQEVIEYTHCNPDKVIVIPNPASGNILFQQKNFNEQKPVFLFIGSTPNKNLERVAEALSGIGCSLRIIGRVNVEWQKVLSDYNIDYSTCLGLTDGELAAEYIASDVILFPSLYEGFGLPILEGQQAGRPVITSNISPMKEVAGDGACIVDPYNVSALRKAVLEIIQNKTYRELLVKQGFNNVKRFSIQAISGQYIKLYESVLHSEKEYK